MIGQLLEKLLVFAPWGLRHVHSLILELIDGNCNSVSDFNTMDNLIILFITL